MSHVAEDMKELSKIVSELKITNTKAKELRTHKKELESKILEYLESTDQPGLKYHELVVLKSESTIHTRLKKKEKQDSIIKILEENGVEDAEKLYEAVSKAGIGEAQTKAKLKVKTVLPEIF